MARTGRPPKPAALHRLQGTFEPGRHAHREEAEPVPLGDLSPVPPDYLSPGAKRVWTATLPFLTRGTVGGGDQHLFGAFCAAVAIFQDAVAAQARLDEGKTLPFLMSSGAKNTPILSHYLKAIRNSSEQIRLLGAELGLSPTSRARIGAMAFAPDAPMRSAEDPWSQFKVLEGGRK